MFVQQLTPQQKQETVAALKALLASRHRGISVFARERDIPRALAHRIIDTMVRGRTLVPLLTLRANEVTDVMRHFKHGTRGECTKAERALAAIIRKEIVAERFVPIFTHASLTGIGGDVPEHVVVTAEQAPSLTG